MENHVKFIFHSALQPSFEPPQNRNELLSSIDYLIVQLLT